MALNLFYSNRVEELYAHLKYQLFAAPGNPFRKRLIVVPNPPLKTWLMQQLAKDPEIGIAAGIEVTYPDEMIDRFSESPLFPSRLSLALAIEGQLRRMMSHAWEDTWTAVPAGTWEPVLKYLKAPHLTRKGERRLIALSDKLSELFIDYQKYGRRMLADWGKGWQQELWRLLFPEIPALSFKKAKGDVHLHLFAISHLSPFHLDRFVEIAERIPTHYYLLSPCQAFWSDIRTDRESRRLHAFWKSQGAAEAQLATLDHYLRDCNPLLANFGRLGREMVRQLEERDSVSDEKYVLPASVLQHPAYENLIGEIYAAETDRLILLEALQADLLLMRKPQEKIAFEGEDTSIQVHSAATRLRETEVVYDLIQNLIARHADDSDPLKPEEILVMAPDIMEYAPLVKMIFQREKGLGEKGLDCHIMEAVAPCDYPTIQGFLNFLKLAAGRWNAREVLELFDIPSFKKKHRFCDEDVMTIRQWVQKSGVRWGQTGHHRDEVLEGQHCRSGMIGKSDAGTWEKGMERLLRSLISSEGIVIESSQAELLGRFLDLVRSMRSDLNFLGKKTSLTLCEWISYLEALFESYFDEDLEQLSKHLADLTQAGLQLPKEKFPFATIFHHLEDILKKRRNSYRETHLNSVRFCPLLPMRTVPAKVVILMGLEEGAFPRAATRNSLNLLHSHPQADYSPSKTDFDRYLFLEAILSARQYLILTYQGFSQQDGKEQAPSLVVQELMAYLDSGYLVGGQMPSSRLTIRHPFHGYDKANFKPESHFPSRSLYQFRLAQSYYLKEKETPFLFIPRFEMRLPSQKSDLIFDIADLGRFAKNPLKIYLNKTLGLYLSKEDELQTCESFAWSPLDRSILRRLALKNEFPQMIQHVEERLPLGIFREIALREAADTQAEIRENLKQFGVHKTFCLELTKRVASPMQLSETHWLAPPLQIRTGSGESVTLVGKLEEISENGMVALHERKFEKAVQIYPQFLLFDTLAQRGGLPLKERQLIFGRDGEVLPSFLDQPEQRLSQYLDYYLLSLSNPSPLMPKWIDSLIKGDNFEKQMTASLEHSRKLDYEEELLWLMRGSHKIDADSIFRHWKPIAGEIFSDLHARCPK